MLAIDVNKREKELYNLPFSDFMKGYPVEIKQWWDNYGPSNWGAATEDTAAALGISELQEIGADTVPTIATPGRAAWARLPRNWPRFCNLIARIVCRRARPQWRLSQTTRKCRSLICRALN